MEPHSGSQSGGRQTNKMRGGPIAVLRSANDSVLFSIIDLVVRENSLKVDDE